MTDDPGLPDVPDTPAVRGYFHPKTATGAASLIPSPPWRYSGDLLTVEYRTDPARVRELLPAPLELVDEDQDPGAVALIWADWQSCSADGRELLDPVRAQYKEAFAVVRCRYRGRTFTRCVFIWVNKDFAIARGLHQGYPKKLGSIHQTRPHPYGPAPRIQAGARFGATLAAADRRLAEAVVTLREPCATNGFVNAHPMAHHRWLPSIETGKGLALDELIETGAASSEGGQPWTGDAELRLFEAPTEELARLEIREPIAAYYRQVGVVWDGGRLLESNTSGAA
ncbi:acetoacetate decarboxylase family protein [Streptomyces sp. SGAir0957]